jgi:hypothetical protein
MQMIWMVLVTLVLALSGVVGLTLRPCCRLDQATMTNSTSLDRPASLAVCTARHR